MCFGMEIEPLYCDVTIRRWQDYTKQEALEKLNTWKTNKLTEINTEFEKILKGIDANYYLKKVEQLHLNKLGMLYLF